MAFRVVIIGGTGQVGAEVVRALAAEPACAEVVMVNRRAIVSTASDRVRQVILDTADAQFSAAVAEVAQRVVAHGDRTCGVSCVAVGTGSLNWSEEQLRALEIGVVGGFARGCRTGGITQFALLSAVGSNSKSRFRYLAASPWLRDHLVLAPWFASVRTGTQQLTPRRQRRTLVRTADPPTH